MLTRDLKELDLLIVQNLHRIRQIPFDVVVHLPRSGTIPASLIATYLKTPFASVEEYTRGIVNTRKAKFKTLHRILLVDDSIRTGIQMKKNIALIKRRRPDSEIYTLAVFSTKFDRDFQPTLFLSEHAETMYIYPWFMWKTERIEHCAIDFDGVLCRDCTAEEDDDGEKYTRFLESACQKFHTDFPIGAIVTSRLEKYRPQTEAWLAERGYQYGSLIMGPWASKEERRGKQAEWKASVYRDLPQLLFVESSEREAKDIATLSGKAVWCIDTQQAYGKH